jgi:uncharacterized protein YggE
MSTTFVSARVIAQDTPQAPATAAQCCNQNDNTTRLDISATADIQAKPDVAILTAGIVTNAATAGDALKSNSNQMNTVFAEIKKAGIAEKDYQTSNFQINPQYVYVENQPPSIKSYEARNSLTIKVRDMAKIGPMLDVLVVNGANDISGPTFIIDKPDALQDQARGDAVAKARAQADVYAKAAGLKVKRIIAISENTQNYQPPRPMMAKMAMAADAAGSSTPVATGEVEMSATVNVAFELE